MEEMQGADRMVDTISVEQTGNSTYSINQVLAGGFDARANLQVSDRERAGPREGRLSVRGGFGLEAAEI